MDSQDQHLSDQEFYAFIKLYDLINQEKDLEEETLSFWFFTLGEVDYGTTFNRLGPDLTRCGLTVRVESYELEKKLDKAKKEIEKQPQEKRAKLLTILDHIQSGKKIKTSDLAAISWVWYDVYESTKLTPNDYKIPVKFPKLLKEELDSYLEKLISDGLMISKANYYRFDLQKKILIGLIEKDEKIRLYGKNFILKIGIEDDGTPSDDPDFCVLQTAYAMQKLGYLSVTDIWCSSVPTGGTFRLSRSILNINLILDDSFVQEVNDLYKKKNPKSTIVSFDPKKGLLKFLGKEVELSKKGKETDAVLLLSTLLKKEGSDWMHNDEILEDWGYNDVDLKELPKNKVYFAGQKINNAVALKTQIEDFIECNTSKARINPKYRKVDE